MARSVGSNGLTSVIGHERNLILAAEAVEMEAAARELTAHSRRRSIHGRPTQEGAPAREHVTRGTCVLVRVWPLQFAWTGARQGMVP